MLNEVMKKLSKWDSLKTVQTNKIVSSTYIWLIIVPLFAKAFLKIESIGFTLNETFYSIDLTLPFSWKFFFFSALSFVIGNLIYLFFSSEFIKKYDDYGDFKAKGALVSEIENFVSSQDVELKKNVERLVNIARYKLEDQKVEAVEKIDNAAQKEREYFWVVYNEQNEINIKSRYWCLFFYALGGVLFLCVAIPNVWWVLVELFG